MSENNGSSVFVQMLRGRDVSLGGTGSLGGTDVDLLGKMDKLEPLDPKDPLVGGGGGGHLHQVGEEFLPTSWRH